MSSVECLREFVTERLTAAAEEIFGVFIKTIVEYEEEINRQRRLLDVFCKPEVKLHRIELPQQHVFVEEAVPADQQLCNQERSTSPDQVDPEPLQIKEEEEELCTSQHVEQLDLKQETDTFMFTYEESDYNEPEPKHDQQLLYYSSHVAESRDEKGGNYGASGSEQNSQHEGHSSNVYNLNMSGIGHNTHTAQNSFKCDTCGKEFRHNSKLQRHARVHTGEKPYSCITCGKDFRFSSGLKVHMRTHTGEKPYLCNTCGKRFSDMPGLKKHVRIHTGEKPYLCNTCGKRFGDMPALKKHIRIHTGEKPYSCITCGKDFRFSSVLKVHMRTHTDEKPYLCKTCGKGFGELAGLKRHIRIHTGEKPYSCKTCGKDFRFGSYLTVHIRRAHTGERPYPCKICGKRYFDASHLAKHIRTHSKVALQL
ncbi:zinc finger protein 501-like [Dicentrarchus labrax]|uniref:zinc finger protein 501-like n=1 Tax=Dicentrarchus labrax TaxID=13489 RepID=UPI0021F4FEF6|nr:zinc finger protein 501-like [Dicentrarchus labrax]